MAEEFDLAKAYKEGQERYHDQNRIDAVSLRIIIDHVQPLALALNGNIVEMGRAVASIAESLAKIANPVIVAENLRWPSPAAKYDALAFGIEAEAHRMSIVTFAAVLDDVWDIIHDRRGPPRGNRNAGDVVEALRVEVERLRQELRECNLDG